MAFEKMIKNAFEQSRNNTRFGDTLEEIREIQDYIKMRKRYTYQTKMELK